MSPARPHVRLAQQHAELAEHQRRQRDAQRATALAMAAAGKDDLEIAAVLQVRLETARELLRPVLRRRNR